MTMNKELHSKVVEALCQWVEEQRTKLTEHELPPPAVIKTAIEGVIAKRGRNTIRRSAPVFREHPLGSLLHRYINMHGNAGAYVASALGAGWDAEMLEKAATSDPTTYGSYWTADKSLLFVHGALVRGVEKLGDKLDTLALVLRNGPSAAAEAWQRAIYGK